MAAAEVWRHSFGAESVDRLAGGTGRAGSGHGIDGAVLGGRCIWPWKTASSCIWRKPARRRRHGAGSRTSPMPRGSCGGCSVATSRSALCRDAEQRRWRILARTRVQFCEVMVQMRNHIEGLLEEGQIKLSSYVTDLFGASGWRILNALGRGRERCEPASGTGRSPFGGFAGGTPRRARTATSMSIIAWRCAC